MNPVRAVSWVKAARRDFEAFPAQARIDAQFALTMVAGGGKPDNAKPLKGFGGGVYEIILKSRGDAFRVVYVVQLDDQLWVIHAFQKKSKSGIKTPKAEIDLIHERLKRLKETLA